MVDALATLSIIGGAVQAQSSVTLYGRVEADYSSARTTTSTYNYGTGVETTAIGKSSGLTDGAAGGVAGSRFGFKGSEDLGGGLKAEFNLENRFNSNDGTMNGVLFNHRSWVGLSSSTLGSLALGRNGTPSSAVSIATDVDAMSAFSLPSFITGSSRRDNAITYTTPSFQGFSATAQVGKAKNTTSITTNTGFSSNAGTDASGQGFNLAYASGPVYVGFGYDMNKNVSNTATNTFSKTGGWILGGSYDFTSFKLLANYTQHKTTGSLLSLDGIDSMKVRDISVGAAVPFGNTTLLGSVGKAKLKIDGDSESFHTEWLLGATYSLSKRTSVFVRTGKNVGGFAINSGADTLAASEVRRTSVGLTHTF